MMRFTIHPRGPRRKTRTYYVRVHYEGMDPELTYYLAGYKGKLITMYSDMDARHFKTRKQAREAAERFEAQWLDERLARLAGVKP